MEELKGIPEWLGAAVIGAVLAALGYVAKLIAEWIAEINERRRSRRADLVELYSLLRAGRVAFTVQGGHRDTLFGLIRNRDPELVGLASQEGYDHVFAMAYSDMTEREKELHGIIRAITQFTLRPLNEAMLRWLQEDSYFKTRTWGRGLRTDLAESLSKLEVHLLLWMAKYEVWIPSSPENALVYLADEMKHGIEFPRELEGYVERALGMWWLSGA